MQFLVIEKIATQTGLPPELFRQVPNIVHAIGDYNAALTKQGKVKASWNLADTPGGAYVLDVDSTDELLRILSSSPANAFPLTREVHPVDTVAAGIGIIETAFREAIAHQDAAARQR